MAKLQPRRIFTDQIHDGKEVKEMGWFETDEEKKQKELMKRDWNSRYASQVSDRPNSAYGTVEIHERLDGRFQIVKDGFGNTLSVTKL